MAMETKTYETSRHSSSKLSLLLWCSPLKIDRQNPRRCIFIFDSPKPELISKWQEGKANVNALAFHNAYQELFGVRENETVLGL